MQSRRIVREGSVGLLILVGVGLFVALALWLRGFSPGKRSYRAIVGFVDAAGLQEGAAVRYRGVAVGKVTKIGTGPSGVEVEIELPGDVVIPRDVVVEANQSGLISEASLDIRPLRPVPSGAIATKPLDRNCNEAVIICNGTRLQGEIGVSVDQLVRASVKFADLYSDPRFFNNVNAAAKNTAVAAAGVAQLTREFSGLSRSLSQDVNRLSTSASSNLNTISASAATSANAVGQAANQISLTAGQLNSLVASNRSTLVSTLNNLNQTSTRLRSTVSGLSPVVDRVQQGQLLNNLETLSANAAQASANLRDVSTALNSPTNLLVLQQTLDSARSTFQNAQKITADLDELTGDPAFRTNLRNLVNGLSGLVSSTQQLQQQAQVAQVLAPLSAEMNSAEMNTATAKDAASTAGAAPVALPSSEQIQSLHPVEPAQTSTVPAVPSPQAR